MKTPVPLRADGTMMGYHSPVRGAAPAIAAADNLDPLEQVVAKYRDEFLQAGETAVNANGRAWQKAASNHPDEHEEWKVRQAERGRVAREKRNITLGTAVAASAVVVGKDPFDDVVARYRSEFLNAGDSPAVANGKAWRTAALNHPDEHGEWKVRQAERGRAARERRDAARAGTH